MIRHVVLSIVSASLVGCSGGGSSAPGSACHAEAQLTIAGNSNGSTPLGTLPSPPQFVDPGSAYFADATYLYFATNQVIDINSVSDLLVTGTPVLTGSDGSVIDAGTLQAVQTEHDDGPVLYGYSASIGGLKTSTTYTVAFPSLDEVETGCAHGAESAGSFTTNSALAPPNTATAARTQ